jgi:hypothetical protein
MASTLNAMLGCIRALSEAEAHIRATAYDHHLQAANKARSALDALRASYAAPATSEQST